MKGIAKKLKVMSDCTSLQIMSSDLNTLSEQFEYRKFSCETTKKILLNIIEQIKEIN